MHYDAQLTTGFRGRFFPSLTLPMHTCIDMHFVKLYFGDKRVGDFFNVLFYWCKARMCTSAKHHPIGIWMQITSALSCLFCCSSNMLHVHLKKFHPLPVPSHLSCSSRMWESHQRRQEGYGLLTGIPRLSTLPEGALQLLFSSLWQWNVTSAGRHSP